jgi:hypothetical protein
MRVPDEDEIAEQVRYQPIAEATRKGRDARFRIVVLSNYTFACALTRYRLTTVSSESIVDAAHIHEFSFWFRTPAPRTASSDSRGGGRTVGRADSVLLDENRD